LDSPGSIVYGFAFCTFIAEHFVIARVVFVTNIYVGNLSFRATEDELRDAFSRFGEVSKVSIVIDRDTGRSRGFAFVEMPNANEAQSAIDGLNEQEVAGRRVSCNEARPKEAQSRSPYSGGSGGGRGGPRSGGGGGEQRRPYRDH